MGCGVEGLQVHRRSLSLAFGKTFWTAVCVLEGRSESFEMPIKT